jgi:hypothetical protein
MKKMLLSVLVIGMVSGCSWVEPTEEAKNVNVVGEVNVASCKKLGTVSVEVRPDLVLGIERNPEKVTKELATLARNRAADNGADSIVPATPIENGKQKFSMYRCAP